MPIRRAWRRGGGAALCGLAALLLAPGAGTAQEPAQDIAPDRAPDRLYLPLASRHIGLDPADFGRTRWNEVNPGALLVWEDRFLTLDYGVGAFLNSFDEISITALVGKTWEIGQDANIGAILQFSDYRKNSEFFPVALGSVALIPALQLRYRNVFALAQPGYQGGVLAAGITFALR